jgi:DNA-directed RNA polymerase subunit RPC12/RpoP
MIHFRCTYCGRKLKTPVEYEGRQGVCPLCGQHIWVPRITSGSDTEEIPVLPLLPDETIEEDPSKSGVLGKGESPEPEAPEAKAQSPVAPLP